jgi:hypothetical protein
MSLDFLTPWGALLWIVVLVPVLALWLVRRQARRVRGTLELVEPASGGHLVALAAMLAFGALLALAAAQPVLEQTNPERIRTDAEVLVVIDISRSMLASTGARGRMRIERAKTAAAVLRSALSGVPVGLASLTDRVLPHLFPSADRRAFERTLRYSLGIERPPPRSGFATSATNLESLASVRTQRYFSGTARKRLLVVLTDGETQPVAGARLRALFRRAPAIEVVFLRFWDAEERVYAGGAPEPQYLPDPSSGALLARIAGSVSGSVYPETEVGKASRKARELIGSGPTVVRGEFAGRIALAPFLVAAALLPLALLLTRRTR